MTEIHTPLDGVLAMNPSDRVRNLHTGLVRERRTLQERGNANAEAAALSVGERDVRRQPQRIGVARQGCKRPWLGHNVFRFKRSRRLSEFKLEIAAILETHLISQIGGNQGIEFSDAPSVLDIVITKTRDSETVGGLRLNTCGRRPAHAIERE